MLAAFMRVPFTTLAIVAPAQATVYLRNDNAQH